MPSFMSFTTYLTQYFQNIKDWEKTNFKRLTILQFFQKTDTIENNITGSLIKLAPKSDDGHFHCYILHLIQMTDNRNTWI